MAILKEKEVRRKPRATRTVELVNDLTPEERTNVLAALQVLRVRFVDWVGVAKALGISHKVVQIAARNKKPSAGLAIRIARLAGVPVDDVLSGAFPKPGSCPMCGRGGD